MERIEKYYNQIKNSPVFFGMSDEELKGLLECFHARVRKYEKEEMKRLNKIRHSNCKYKGNVKDIQSKALYYRD